MVSEGRTTSCITIGLQNTKHTNRCSSNNNVRGGIFSIDGAPTGVNQIPPVTESK